MKLALAVSGVLLACLVAACGSDDGAEPAAAPAGYRTVQTSHFSIALPDGWSVRTGPPAQRTYPGEVVTEARGPAGAGGITPAILIGVTPDNQSSVAEIAELNRKSKGLNFPGARTRRADLEVPGAEGAVRLDTTFPAVPQPDGTVSAVDAGGSPGAIAFTITDVIAKSSDGAALDLAVQQPRGGGVDVAAVIGTFRVR